jgi:hypothetical protein
MIFQTFPKSISSYKKRRLLSSSRTFNSRTRNFKLCFARSSDSEKTNIFILERFGMVKIWIQEFLDLKESSSSINLQDDLTPLLKKIVIELVGLYLLKGSNSPSEELDQIKKKKWNLIIYRSEKSKSHKISRKKSDLIISISQFRINNSFFFFSRKNVFHIKKNRK